MRPFQCTVPPGGRQRSPRTAPASEILDTPFQSITRYHVDIPENLFANVVLSVDQLWLQNWRAHDEGLQDKRESILDGLTILDFCWHAKTRGTCLMCHSSEGALRDFPSVAGPRSARMLLGMTSLPSYSSSDNEGEVRPLSAPLAFGENVDVARRFPQSSVHAAPGRRTICHRLRNGASRCVEHARPGRIACRSECSPCLTSTPR